MGYKRINILIIAVLLVSNLLYFSAALANTDAKTENVEILEETPEEIQPEEIQPEEIQPEEIQPEEIQPEDENTALTPTSEIEEESGSTSIEENTAEDAATDSSEVKAADEKEDDVEEIEVLEEEYDVSSMDLQTSEIAVTEDSNSGNDLFDFEAFIKKADVLYGTAPFDDNDDPGNDSGNKNGTVRTFDTVTYPIKVTINPKKAEKLNNIVIRVKGTLENGITNNRVNAKFAVGGYEDLEAETVGFEQTYTIAQTGNSVMIPISIEVQGAEHGLQLVPELDVQVISVDGVDVTEDKVSMVFDGLDAFKTSGKSSIKPYIRSGLTGKGLAYIPYSMLVEDTEESSNIMPFSVSFGIQKLPGKSDIRGATFPAGEIKYRLDLSGQVYWDGENLQGKYEALNFKQSDTPLYLFDQHPINFHSKKTGSKNTLSEGLEYNFTYSENHSAPLSVLPDLKQASIDKWGFRSVWDSGKWEIEKPIIDSSIVSYSGTTNEYIIGSTFPEHRADGYTGTRMFGENDKLFSSNAFILKVPNEYTIGGKNNPEGIANNVFYKATVIVESYEDEHGEVHKQNEIASVQMQERNNPTGAYSINNTFLSYPSNRDLGTRHIGDGTVSHGDPSVIIGTDVKYISYTYTRMISYGGLDMVFRWNADSFELTKEYAAEAEKNMYSGGYKNANLETIQNNQEKQKFYYGVQKFTDNTFESFTSKGKDDYTWYSTYDEAVKHGKIGAMKNEIKDVVGASTLSGRANIPLHVKTKNIGSFSTQKTPNIIVTNGYAYLDAKRERMIDISANRSYSNPTLYDEEGTLTKMQTPVGSSINFETLGIMNAETTSNITSDKTTYYNSEEVDWTVKSSIILPYTGVPERFDGSVEIKQVLPKGLDYKVGSGQIGKTKKEPSIVRNEDGSVFLIWDILVSEKNTLIEDISFSTTINPFALSSGVQSSLTVTNTITSELDTRREHLRTSSQTINILKVGMVGIYESIDREYGPKNSSFTINMKPYTTIEEEYEVKGITILPFNKDKLGSSFNGSLKLSKINVTGGNEVSIYLNNSVVENDKPNKVDLTSNGWYKYDGDKQDLSQVASILFHVEGVLSNDDNVNIAFTIDTEGNKFGDVYFNETTINSATDYKLSPISNKVKYAIRAASELSLERIQIYTANFEEGLPVKVRIKKEIINNEALEEKGKLAIYEKESNKKLFEKEFIIGQLERENSLLIPSEFLSKDSNNSYEVRIEGVDEDLIHVLEQAATLDTLGYTASQRKLKLHVTEASELEYKGVVMTEREVGKEMVVFYENLKIPLKKINPIKSGYGMEMDFEVHYSNELGLGKMEPFEAEVKADAAIVDGIHEVEEGKVTLKMLSEIQQDGNSSIQRLTLPRAYVEVKTGSVFTEEQKEENIEEIQYELLDGGNKVYVPIWIDELGAYDMSFKNTGAIGINEISFDITDTIEVFAYMYGYIGSETIEDDEILIEPVDLKNPFPQGLPEGWDPEDVSWFTSN